MKPLLDRIRAGEIIIADGAMGLTLAAETAVGKYSMACLNMINKLIRHAEVTLKENKTKRRSTPLITCLESSDYLLQNVSSALISSRVAIRVSPTRSPYAVTS